MACLIEMLLIFNFYVLIVFGLDKFISYLLCSHIIVFTDHATLRYLLKKHDVKPRLTRWMLLLQEFDIEIRDRNGVKNLIANHLNKIKGPVGYPWWGNRVVKEF